MAVTQTTIANYTLPTLSTRNLKRSHSDMRTSYSSNKWIDEDVYRSTILQLYHTTSESEVDEDLHRDALDLGLSPMQISAPTPAATSSPSATTINSDTHQGSIMSQSTAPTSCDSSERRPSTSLSNRSSKVPSNFGMSTSMAEIDRRRNSGFRSGFRRITTFRKKKSSSSSTPSISSMTSTRTGHMTNESTTALGEGTFSEPSSLSYPFHDSLVIKENFESEALVDQEALQRTMDCDQMTRIRAQQLDEKRRFLEYQNKLISELMAEKAEEKRQKRELHRKKIEEQEEKNEKAVEELEARQLEDEMKQNKEHEAEKRAIQMRLRHMEAYCQTPSPPTSPVQPGFHRGSIDSTMTIPIPERHVTQQHYENLAQAYHVRDNMDVLQAAKITVLRGKQKRTLQNLMLKRERIIEHLESEEQKDLDLTEFDYGKQEAEIRQEFAVKREKLEGRWRLQILIEKTRMERRTGLRYECLPDMLAVETPS